MPLYAFFNLFQKVVKLSVFCWKCYSTSFLYSFTCQNFRPLFPLLTKAESNLNFNYPINCSVKSTLFRLISYSVYSPAMPEIRLIQHPICTNE